MIILSCILQIINNLAMFNNLTVIELASVLAGPGVGQFFAELGAKVIKVENLRTGGDVTRTWKIAGEQTDGRSAYFCAANWGKQSVALDLTQSDGQEIVKQLCKQADIVIVSYKPGDAQKLGVDYNTLATVNSKLIYGSITGYGQENNRVGYDAVIQAEAGFMFMNGEPGRQSLKMPVALIDILAGHQLKEALLLALLHRERTGKGKYVEVSLIQSGVASLVNQATNYLMTNQLPVKKGSVHPNIAPYGDVFVCADGKELLLAVGSDKQFQQLCHVLTIAHVSSDSRFAKNADRVNNREALYDLLSENIGKFTADHLLKLLVEHHIPGGIINSMQDVFEQPEARELLLRHDAVYGVRSFVANGDFISQQALLPPPHFGEHTESILLAMLNFNQGEIDALRIADVIN